MWTKFKAWYKALGAKSKADHEARERAYHMEWVKKNVPYVTHELYQNIVFQLWASDVKFPHVNKWLRWLGKNPIMWYAVVDKKNGTLKYGFELPTEKERQDAKAKGWDIVLIK